MNKLISTIVASVIAASTVLSVGATANASSQTFAKISDITIEGPNNNTARVALAVPTIGGRPACHTANFTVHYAIDLSTNAGKAQLAGLQAAQLAGKQISIVGSNTCINFNGFSLEGIQALTTWT